MTPSSERTHPSSECSNDAIERLIVRLDRLASLVNRWPASDYGAGDVFYLRGFCIELIDVQRSLAGQLIAKGQHDGR